jgi:serine/threonine protein kinase
MFRVPTLTFPIWEHAPRLSIRRRRRLAFGGWATSSARWRGRPTSFRRPVQQVAVKVLDPELGAVLGAERFLTDIRVTANLQHPNLLPLFDSGEAAGLLFYVMPFVEGESLRHRLDRERQLPLGAALRIAKEIASALDYAHRNGVIHRDIKPENVLLHDGQALIGDFGIALAVQSAGAQRMTQTGLSLGTPQYMSPEQRWVRRSSDPSPARARRSSSRPPSGLNRFGRAMANTSTIAMASISWR